MSDAYSLYSIRAMDSFSKSQERQNAPLCTNKSAIFSYTIHHSVCLFIAIFNQ